MKNPWIRKNPFMSMWMSGANAVLGSARGRATAAGRRQAATLMATGTQQAIRFWTGGIQVAKPRRTARGK